MPEPSAVAARVIRFGVFELEVRSGELRKSGVRLSLPDQPLQVLICLLERPGALVTRDELRQQLWRSDTFVDFEHGLNAAVKRLRDVLGDSADTPRFVETVPRRGYRFVAPVEGNELAAVPATAIAATDSPAPPTVTLPRKRWWWAVASSALVVILALTGGLLLWPTRPTQRPAMHMAPLTTMSGSEYGPTFSPDGRYVAFGWNGEAQDNWDIYVKLVGSSELRRLTTNQFTDMTPSWSPDGRQIAYLRYEPPYASQQVRVMSALGGSDRNVSDFPAFFSVVWSPDGRYLVAGHASPPGAAPHSGDGLYLIPLDGGEPRAITDPRPPETHQAPAFSPDGHRLAYVTCPEAMRMDCSINVLDVNPAWAAIGPPRRLASVRSPTNRWLTWSRDGQSVIYTDGLAGLTTLWRVGVDGGRPRERIEVAGVNATFPSTAPAGDRLAFSRSLQDKDIYRFEPKRPAHPIARSSAIDEIPQFSPDGGRITFCSLRSGDAAEIWVANKDGTAPEQLTHGPGGWQCSPAWSPDGRQIAFDSLAEDGTWHIWMVDLERRTPVQITKDPGDQNRPTWSRNGEWIYFSWRQGDQRDIWRTQVRTGARERVTTHANAIIGRESLDGKSLLYTSPVPESDLMTQPLAGGPPQRLIKCVWPGSMVVNPGAIYYLPCLGGKPLDDDAHLRVMDPATGKDRELGRLERFEYDSPYFAVSPDGRTVLYTRVAGSGADLMTIENFR
jgi:Tol biopolymer transport system component/DNA-binding winged helix-turn-helix (wHTH) protein